MAALLIDGKKVTSDIKEGLRKEVTELKTRGITPCLAVIYDRTDPYSKRYVTLKEKACADIGMEIQIRSVEKTTSRDNLIKIIDRLNEDTRVNGILLQFPFHEELYKKTIINSIAAEKDIDCCGPSARVKLIFNEPGFIPCTPYGVIKMQSKVL